VLRLELKKTFLSKRGWWIYLLALGPVVLTLIHWMFENGRGAGVTAWARTAWCSRAVHLLLLEGRNLFRCMGIFSNLFRGEMLEKTLHYYF
jgi:hypothetical protein